MQSEVRACSLRCKTLLRSGNMGWSREPKGMTAPAVIGAVLGKHLETGFGLVQPICVVGWVTWEVYGSVLVSVNICISRARGKVCMEQNGAWGFNLKDRTLCWRPRTMGWSREPRRVTALLPLELPTPLYSSDLHRDAWFVIDNVGKGLPCKHASVTC